MAFSTTLVFVMNGWIPAAEIDPKCATPPAAKRIPHQFTLHGVEISDDYFWLKDKKSSESIGFLNAENEYRTSVMKPTESLQKTLYDEFLSRIKQTDLSVPYREGNYWYLTKTFQGKQYPTFARRRGSVDGPEEVMLDVDKLAAGKKFMSARPIDVSDDEKLLLYTSDVTGYREYFLSVVDLSTGKMIQDRFVKAVGAAWTADNRTIFYVTEDAAKRPHKLWRHTVGEPAANDTLVYEEKDGLFRLGVRRSRDKKFLFLGASSSTTSEQWFLNSDDPTGEWKPILGRKNGREYQADHRDGKFYVRTNDAGAVNFKIETYAVGSEKPEGAFVPYDPNVFVSGLGLFKDFAVVSERVAGVPQLRVVDFAARDSHRIDFPEPIYSARLGANPEFDTTNVQLSYTSFVTPNSVYEYDLKTRDRKLLKRTEVPAGHNPDDYAVERLMATSHDGVKVPVSIFMRRNLKRDGTAPCLLYGYGSYGATTDVGFDPIVLSLLDRGVVYAVGHVRGSADLGRTWYDDGKMMKKRNTFLDFAACADFLVSEKFCARDRLAIQGGSAGGLLVGATINLRPELCKAAILEVPFLDVVNTMLDESLPLTVQEFLEWGNPKKPEEFAYLRTYCPYTNIQKTKYPMMMVTTSLNDSQVAFHEPAKYVAKMRAVNPDASIFFKCNMDAGHGGASGRYDRLKERALVMAFVLDALGATEKVK